MWQGLGISWERSHLKKEQFCTATGMLLSWGRGRSWSGPWGLSSEINHPKNSNTSWDPNRSTLTTIISVQTFSVSTFTPLSPAFEKQPEPLVWNTKILQCPPRLGLELLQTGHPYLTITVALFLVHPMLLSHFWTSAWFSLSAYCSPSQHSFIYRYHLFQEVPSLNCAPKACSGLYPALILPRLLVKETGRLLTQHPKQFCTPSLSPNVPHIRIIQ